MRGPIGRIAALLARGHAGQAAVDRSQIASPSDAVAVSEALTVVGCEEEVLARARSAGPWLARDLAHRIELRSSASRSSSSDSSSLKQNASRPSRCSLQQVLGVVVEILEPSLARRVLASIIRCPCSSSQRARSQSRLYCFGVMLLPFGPKALEIEDEPLAHYRDPLAGHLLGRGGWRPGELAVIQPSSTSECAPSL